MFIIFFFKQKTAYEMRISDWSSDVCSSDLNHVGTMYAGALFTLAELPGGALFLASFDIARYYPIVKSLDMRFKKPATSDVFVEMRLDDAQIGAIRAAADATGQGEFELDGQLRTAEATPEIGRAHDRGRRFR